MRPWFPVFVVLLASGLSGCGPTPSGRDAAPIDVSEAPEQTALAEARPEVVRRGETRWQFTPVAHYVVRGVVLSESRYWLDDNAEIAPCDVALGWGRLVTEGWYHKATFSQSGRWYYWRYRLDSGLDNELVADNSANTHIVPANLNVRRAACALSAGDRVELSGELVDIAADSDGRHMTWNTSRSRHDRGGGSCEILYLRRVKRDGTVYE